MSSDLSHAAAATAAKLLQLCLTLCDPRDGSPPDFPAPGILQARTLEWVAISFSNGQIDLSWTVISDMRISGCFFLPHSLTEQSKIVHNSK